MSPFPYSSDNKRYHTWNYHLRQVFGTKVCKVALDSGLTCPNRDGSRGAGGCTYCSPRRSGDFSGSPSLPLAVQFELGKREMAKKWPSARFLPYLQAGSSTYAPAEQLRRLWEPLLSHPDTAGLCIATRADCLPPPVLDYLEEINRRTYLIVELGLQTIHDATAKRINRCHTYQEFLQGVQALSERNIRICVHLINGLPGEMPEMMRQSAQAVGRLPIHSVKLHLLHVLRDTPLGDAYSASPFPLMSREEYVHLVCDQLELLPPHIVIQRLTGDGDARALLAPLWSRRKREVLNEIDRELSRRNTVQGAKSQV
ncbi:MAG: TIGR01212 family radical SAM protein [Oscillospiraceae bacterium]|nr:TIGR01212 family radical SAM protein [Oscillospiraceae bacterium]